MSGEATPPLIVAVLLASETDATRGHVVTTLTLPSSHLTLPLTKLRPTLTSSLPSSLRQRSFIFLTTHGWEVEQAMEKTTRVSQVFREDSCMISIRLSYPQPRLGLVAEGHPHIPLGFIFCDPAQPLSHLSRELQAQLPSLHRSLTATGYSVLDSSGWPIAREQEHLFTLAEAVCGRMIRLLCHPQTRQPSLSLSLLPPAGSLEHTRPSLSLPELPQGMAEERAEVAESSLLEQSMTTDSYSSTMAPTAPPGTTPYEILLSYVHKEAADEATSLKEALHEAGYRVFLDVDCIQGGTDWQDVLNDAISNCKVFVPLITNQYGQTLWTNREVKLADVLGKVIIPVNFLSSWPPKCLAIQFAATQFISWLHSSPDEDWDEDTVTKVCSDIVQRYKLEVEGGVMGIIAAEGAGEEEGEGEGEDTPNSFAQMDTQIIVEKEEEEEEEERRQVQMLAKVATGQFSPLQAPQLPRTHRRSTLKSYASSLPSSLPEGYRKSIQESRTGKPLVIISCHTSQKEFGHKLAGEMEGRGYEVWCSCDIMNLTDETASLLFQKSADEAGVVVFVLSKEFTECSFCEKQVYYCEQRKRIIPLIFEAVQLPHWASMLIGTSTFVDCRASSYRQTLFERVEEAVNPSKREVSLQVMLREKGEVARLCAEVSAKLPKGVLVYVSGGTRFFSPCGEEVCREFGRQLAQDLNISLVTGGFYGVGETVGRSFHEQRLKNGQASGVWHVVAERDSQDKSSQTRQNKDGSFPPVPYGQTLFAGSSVRQRETLTPHVVGLCVLIEGGPGAAFEAQQFAWWGNWVIPVKMTGGAAGGLFNVPQTIFQRPPCIAEADWSLLGDKDATPSQVAAAIVRIIRTLTFEDGVISPQSAGVRRRRKGGVRGGIQRSETMPYEPDTFQPMKRTFSESRSPQLQAKSTSHT